MSFRFTGQQRMRDYFWDKLGINPSELIFPGIPSRIFDLERLLPGNLFEYFAELPINEY